MKNLLYFFLAPILISNNLYSQETTNINKQEKGFFNITELGYHIGFNSRKRTTSSTSYSLSFKDVGALSLKNICGYFITNHFSLGAGFGAEGFQIKDGDFYNTFQLFGDARYYLKNQDNTWYAYTNLGSAVEIDSGFQKGKLFGLGIGSKFMVGWKTAMVASIGYQEQEIKTIPQDIQKIKGISFKVGLMF
jgi:hypothetical protein